MPADYYYTLDPLEEKKIPITFNLLTGLTLSSVAVTHIPPDGQTASNISSPIESGQAYIEIPAGLGAGQHLFVCVPTTSDGDFSPAIRVHVKVDR